MGQSVLVFVSHSSEDKKDLIEPIVSDLEDCYINVWLDKRKILPGDNLRKSIFREGLDKADVALIFFTGKSLQSSWVDKEIKHVLREESKKGNNFDLNKIISIFDSEQTYNEIAKRYPELTDDLLHLMPKSYTKIQFGQLVSAVWSKYLSLQGGDVEVQRQLLAKDKEIFEKDKQLLELNTQIEKIKSARPSNSKGEEFRQIKDSGKIDSFIANKTDILENSKRRTEQLANVAEANAFGLINFTWSRGIQNAELTQKGKDFFKWLLLDKS